MATTLIENAPQLTVAGVDPAGIKGFTVSSSTTGDSYVVFSKPKELDAITCIELFAKSANGASVRASFELLLTGIIDTPAVLFNTVSMDRSGDVGYVSFSYEEGNGGSDSYIVMKSLVAAWDVVSWVNTSSAALTPATNTTLGGVKIGSGLGVDAGGVISVNLPPSSVETATFSFSGTISPTAGGAKWYPPADVTVKKVYFSLRQTSLVDTAVRLKVNGVAEGVAINCVSGESKSEVVNFNKVVSTSDYVTVDIESGAGGEDLFCFVVYEAGDTTILPKLPMSISSYSASAAASSLLGSYTSSFSVGITDFWVVLDDPAVADTTVSFEVSGSQVASVTVSSGDTFVKTTQSYILSAMSPIKTIATTEATGVSAGFTYKY